MPHNPVSTKRGKSHKVFGWLSPKIHNRDYEYSHAKQSGFKCKAHEFCRYVEKTKKEGVMNRTINRFRSFAIAAVLGLILPGLSAIPSHAETFQPQINLGSSANYVLLAHTAITNGATTVITGSTSRIVGISPGVSDVGTVASILFSGATEFQNATDAPTIAQADLQNAMTYKIGRASCRERVLWYV